MSRQPSLGSSLRVVALCAAAYLYVFPYYPAINNPNENVRLYMTAAIVEEGTYIIDTQRERWGWVNDCGVRDGHFYSVKAPGTSMLGVPFYAAYSAWSGDAFDRDEALWSVRVGASVLPMLVFLFFFHRWIGRRTSSPILRDATVLGVGLGSMLLGYTYMFASHTPSAACGFGAFMILADARRDRRLSHGAAWLAGLLATGASAFEYPCFFATLVLCLYSLFALRPWSRVVSFALGALVPVALVMHFQGSAFGDPFTPGHLFVENEAFRAGHEEGFYGAAEFHWEAAWRLLVDPRLGMFALSPMLLASLVGFPLLWAAAGPARRRPLRLRPVRRALRLHLLHEHLARGLVHRAALPRHRGPLPRVGLSGGALRPAPARPPGRRGPRHRRRRRRLRRRGHPSMYYPHLPPELDFPLAHLFSVLIRHDFAPTNAGAMVGWFGSASMVPMVVLGLAALGWASLPHLRRRANGAYPRWPRSSRRSSSPPTSRWRLSRVGP